MGRGHGSIKIFFSCMCPLFSVALSSFCKQRTSSLLCCMLQACSQATIPSLCYLREAGEESAVLLKCGMPVPESDKLKFHGQLPLYLLACRQLNRCNVLLQTSYYILIEAEVWLQAFADFCSTFCCGVHNPQYPPFLLAPIKPWGAEPRSARCALCQWRLQSCLWGAGHSGSAAAA